MYVKGLSLKLTLLMVMTKSYSLKSVHSSAQQATPSLETQCSYSNHRLYPR